MPRFCHRCFQKFTSGRCIIKELTDKETGSIRGSHFFQFLFFSAFYDIFRSKQFLSCLRYQFYLGYCRNTGKCLTSETEWGNMCQILRRTYFTGGMSKKCAPYFGLFDSASVITDSHQCNSTLFYFNNNRTGSCVNGIFHQFFDNWSRSFYHFSCCNFINCNLIQ